MQQMPGQTHNRRAITAKTIGLGCGGLLIAFLAFGLFANYVLGYGPKPAAHVVVAASPTSAPVSVRPPVLPASKPPVHQAVPTAPATTALATSAPVGGGQCQLQTTEDLIVRYVTPGVAPNAQVIGDVDVLNCRSALDMVRQTAPQNGGDCTQVARAKDNPGYDANHVPAGRLKKVILSVGPACS